MAALVTRKGKEILSGRVKGTGAQPTASAQNEPLNIAWGTNPSALTAAATDIALFFEAPESRTAGTTSQTTTTTTNDTYSVTGAMTATSGRVIQEVGLFDLGTKPAGATVAAGGVVASNSSTTLNTSATFTPGNNNYIQIRTEVMQVTAGSGSTALTVTRGQQGTSAISTIAVSDNVAQGNPAGQTGVTGGSMFVHADLAAVNLNNGDSITWTLTVTFT